jgi:pimeloyl-ACP methyl ester carboxylesterase
VQWIVTHRHRFVRLFALGTIALVAVAYAAACAYLWAQQRALIFLPEAAVRRTPGDVGVEFHEITIPAPQGGVLHAWWLPARSALPASPIILYLRGNDGNLGREVERLQALHRHGLSILAIDYRGYGHSSGPAPTELQVYEDASAAWDYLAQGRGVVPGRIILYGHSLGGAVAAELALRRERACGIVMEGAFTSMVEMGQLEYPFVPVAWLLSERFDTAGKLARLDLPMIFVHGTADEVVPVAMSEQLYRAARRDRQLVLVEGATHEEALPDGGPRLAQALAQLVQRCDHDQ